MGTPAPTAGWENFFVAEVGAAAGLTGLVFVAISISLQQIVKSRHLVKRASESLLMLFGVLFVAAYGLIPGQSIEVFGVEIAITGALMWLASTRRHLHAHLDPELKGEARRWLWARVLAAQCATLPLVGAGTLLALGHPRGIYGVPPGTLCAFGAAAFNAWVLMVEIQR